MSSVKELIEIHNAAKEENDRLAKIAHQELCATYNKNPLTAEESKNLFVKLAKGRCAVPISEINKYVSFIEWFNHQPTDERGKFSLKYEETGIYSNSGICRTIVISKVDAEWFNHSIGISTNTNSDLQHL
jgi:hypothetical protein